MRKIILALTFVALAIGSFVGVSPVQNVKAQEQIAIDCGFIRSACDVVRDVEYSNCRLRGGSAAYCYLDAHGEYMKCVLSSGCPLTE